MQKMHMLHTYPSMERIFSELRKTEEAAFLDSSLQNDLGEYSVIACRPYLKLIKTENSFTVNGHVCETPFSEYVTAYLKEHQEKNSTDLPLVSGAIGYFSYDYGYKKEGVLTRHPKTLDIPEAILYFYDLFIIEDHKSQELHLIANGYTENASVSLQKLLHMTEGLLSSSNSSEKELPALKSAGQVSSVFTRKDYMDAVDHMIRYIIDGDIYVVNMTQQLQIRSSCPPYEMFQRLRIQNPSPFGGFLDYGDHAVICASPERFLRMKGRKIKTRPIKGTRKRGQTPEEDLLLKEELAHSAKDQSELLMIVDLERNDLNRVCIPGSVKVTELFEVETYATVFHLIANVEGELAPSHNTMDLIDAAFPGGSITGAPKLRAMELIDQEEHCRRNLYTGSIGYISLNGDCDLNIVIRTAVHKDSVYHLGVGGGITCESDLSFEYEETWQKAKALLDVLQVPKKEDETYEYTTG